MSRFKIGEKVIALTNPKDRTCQPRKRGEIYPVLDIMFCCKCGEEKINIVGSIDHTVFGKHNRCSCGSRILNYGLYWTAVKHFAPLTSLSDAIEYRLKVSEPELEALRVKEVGVQ